MPYFSMILFNLLLVDEKLYFHECIFSFNPLQFNNLMEGIICLFDFMDEELDLHLQVP